MAVHGNRVFYTYSEFDADVWVAELEGVIR
jgi:hypothetical protein